MTFHVELTTSARKELKKLDKYTQKMILVWLDRHLEGCEDPRLFGKALTGDKKGYWRYRIGDYRIITKIKDDRLIIMVINIGHRKEIYKLTIL